MCGITGILSLDGENDIHGAIRCMTDVLVHRGPDDDGALVEGPVALGFRRLAILDLERTGHQPMTSLDGSCTIVFNGEIYNFVELREKLLAKGYRFRSTGDTEVLLNAYCEWGKECLPMLNGMWAFLIYDRRRNMIFGSRDRFGIKPLFMHRGKAAILFSSEIKSIRASGLYRTEIDWSTAADFLVRNRLDEDCRTFFAGIEQLPPASCFELSLEGSMNLQRYWSLPAVCRTDEGAAIEDYAALFEDSVRLHRRSDVPLAVFLSGGIDSTSIICSLARNRDPASPERLKALSFMDPAFDESRFINNTVEQAAADLERVEYRAADVWDDLPRVLWHHDEPVHSTTALIGFRLSQVASRQGIKVILNGQGADETGAGYHSYFHGYWQTVLRELGPLALWRELSAYTHTLGGSKARLLMKVISRAISAQAYRVPAYQQARNRRKTMRERTHPWYRPDLLNALPAGAAGRVDSRYLDGQLRHSVESAPLPLYLRIEDRNAMAHSVEIRVPFLDYRLVELLFQLPAVFKMRGGFNKHIIRRAMSGKIPTSVLERREKMGFPSPADSWMAQLQDNVRDLLNSREAADVGVFDIDAIRRDFERHRTGEVRIGRQIFHVVQFMLWYDNTVKGLHREFNSANRAVG